MSWRRVSLLAVIEAFVPFSADASRFWLPEVLILSVNVNATYHELTAVLRNALTFDVYLCPTTNQHYKSSSVIVLSCAQQCCIAS